MGGYVNNTIFLFSTICVEFSFSLSFFLSSLFIATAAVMTVTAGGVIKTRLGALAQLTARVFGHVYNPTGVRTGNKILRQRLIGPAITSYYPANFGREIRVLKDVTQKFPELDLENMAEEERLDEVERRRRRGKGPPKKGK
ncbi:mitochondrial ribosomal subunit S27-domain-containing protein [Syncephalis fuscata]|nr:mitochondrial ribosomal subunit S27-domain-containing protein [Syncephalis fuscata]